MSEYQGPVKLIHGDQRADAWGRLWVEVDEPIDATELEYQGRMAWHGALTGDADWARLAIESLGHELAIELPDGRTGRMVLNHFKSAVPGAYGVPDVASGYGLGMPPWLKPLMLAREQPTTGPETAASKESAT